MAQNKWRGVMQVKGMLDKIGIVHWMSLSNTPILWIIWLYLTNCTILSQEICFRGSQCYKCSLLVSGWRHDVSLTSQMDFKFARLFEILWQMELVPVFQYKPVPPITYWWIWMSLQEVNISIGTQIRSGSTMINTHWHAKIDAQQLFNFMILPVGRILTDLAVSITGTLQRCPQNFYICQVRRMLSQELWKYPSYRGGAHWLKYQSVHSCYSFAENRSRKTRINESFQPLYPVTAWMKELL